MACPTNGCHSLDRPVIGPTFGVPTVGARVWAPDTNGDRAGDRPISLGGELATREASRITYRPCVSQRSHNTRRCCPDCVSCWFPVDSRFAGSLSHWIAGFPDPRAIIALRCVSTLRWYVVPPSNKVGPQPARNSPQQIKNE